jgi:hypothetical protein
MLVLDALNVSSQDITKHRYFNTNNLWVKLDALKELIDTNHGAVPLPLIKNGKTVDPRDASSPKVWQLETAMGAAIECFKGASAVVVPRERFAPVKTCNDLLAVRSDAYKSGACRPQPSAFVIVLSACSWCCRWSRTERNGRRFPLLRRETDDRRVILAAAAVPLIELDGALTRVM